jgi:hypothetical protein
LNRINKFFKRTIQNPSIQPSALPSRLPIAYGLATLVPTAAIAAAEGGGLSVIVLSAGIVAGLAVTVLAVGGLIYYCRRSRQPRPGAAPVSPNPANVELSMNPIHDEESHLKHSVSRSSSSFNSVRPDGSSADGWAREAHPEWANGGLNGRASVSYPSQNSQYNPRSQSASYHSQSSQPPSASQSVSPVSQAFRSSKDLKRGWGCLIKK